MQAQIVPDATLPNPSSVSTNDNISVITNGTQAGSNLFHSFEEFSVPTGGAASFQQIDPEINNVISRVTGSSISNINGLIEALQTNGAVSSANLFLINPNGIIFGRNALLNIGGSFLASTASSLKFADGNTFTTTTSPSTQPLLTVSVPIGLQFGKPAASIQVQGAGLRVSSGKTLGLVGGNLTLTGGGLEAAAGRIELGSVAGAVTPDTVPTEVSITPIDKGYALGYGNVQNFQDIQLSQRATVTTSGSGGGDIQVQGRRITLTDGSQAITNTQGADLGGTLAVSGSESVEIRGISTSGNPRASGLFAQVIPEATGTGGNITIAAKRLLVQDGATVSTSTSGVGTAGNLTVRAEDLVEVSGFRSSFRSSLRTTSGQAATGDGGNLSVEAGRLIVKDGAQVLSATFGAGKAGNLAVQNATEVNLVGGIAADKAFLPSGLFTQAKSEASEGGGNLSLSTQKLIVQGGAQINSTTSSVNRAGDLTVKAADVELSGDALSATGELITNDLGLPFPSGLFAGTDIGSKGQGGTLTVETNRLNLKDGAVVQTSTLGEGGAGDLIVKASESVELIGTAKGSQFPTSLLAVSGGIPGFPGVVEATGRSGNLRIETGDLTIQDGAAVAVSSLNPDSNGGAGNLQIQAQTIRLDNQGKLTSETASGNGGNIDLHLRDLLLLRRNSKISTSAGIEGAGGNGGNITINTPLIVAVPSENSNITANAFTGTGGQVQIAAQAIFGIKDREEETPLLSDITASSELGVDGVVEINTPNVDPSFGLVNLPSVPIETEVVQACQPGRSQAKSEFFVTGRGGLPPNPTDLLSSDAIQVDWVTLNPEVENHSSPAVSRNSTAPKPTSIVEAQGWVIGNNGEVMLTASVPNVTPYSFWQTLAKCHALKSSSP